MKFPVELSRTSLAATCALLLGLSGCAEVRPWATQSNDQYRAQIIAERPGELMAKLAGQTFRCQAYLELAEAIQALPKKDAEKQLREWAGSGKYSDEIVILCSMLFVGRDGAAIPTATKVGHFQGDSPGNFSSWRGIGTSNGPDWPDWPVALVDGIPFLIAADYNPFLFEWGGAWSAEPGPQLAAVYLEFCLTQAQWTTHRYEPADSASRQRALGTLLKSPNWTRRLVDGEIKYLSYQITDDPPSAPVYLDERNLREMTSSDANTTMLEGMDLDNVSLAEAVTALNGAKKLSGNPDIVVEFDEPLSQNFARDQEKELAEMKSVRLTLHAAAGSLAALASQLLAGIKDGGNGSYGSRFTYGRIEIFPGRYAELVRKFESVQIGLRGSDINPGRQPSADEIISRINHGLRDPQYAPKVIDGKVTWRDVGNGNPPPKTQIRLTMDDAGKRSELLKREITLSPTSTHIDQLIVELKRQLNLNCFLDDDGNLSLEPKLGAE